MPSAKVGLLALLALTVIGALVLRRDRARTSLVGRVIATLLPLLVTFLTSWFAVRLFADVAVYKPGDAHDDLALTSACVPALLAALAPPRWRPLASGVVLAALAALLFGDVLYYRFFGGVLPLLAFGSATHIWDVRDSIGALAETRDAWLLLVAAPGAALAACLRLPPSLGRVPSVVTYLIPIAVFVMGAQPLHDDVEAYTSKRRSWKVFNVINDLKRGGILSAHARDIATALREQEVTEHLGEEERAEVHAYVAEHAAEALRWQAHESFGALRGSNVVMVQLEAIQQWVVDAEVDGEPVMPFFRSLRERGLYYPNVFDQTGGSPTSDAEYLALNGLHPLARGAVAFRRETNDFVAIPELLAARGYSTMSAHAYARGMWNRGVVHARYGIERSYFRRDFPTTKKIGWGMGDKPFFGRVVSLLEEQLQPFFSFLITLSSHHPYNYVPTSVWPLKMKGVPKALRGYLRSARYVDEALRELFEGLEEKGLLENTVVVLYGDHDAKLRFKKKHAKAAAEHLNLDVATLRAIGRRDVTVDRVPLLLVPPPAREIEPATVETVGGQIDIGPTLLHYLGVPAPRSFLGLPLLAAREGEVARQDGAALDDRRLVRRRGKRYRCEARTAQAKKAKLRCKDLRLRAERQIEISTRITLHDLAAGLSVGERDGA